MSIFKHFINELDVVKLIKIESSRVSPYERAVDITKNPKNTKVSSKPKVKRMGRKNS